MRSGFVFSLVGAAVLASSACAEVQDRSMLLFELSEAVVVVPHSREIRFEDSESVSYNDGERDTVWKYRKDGETGNVSFCTIEVIKPAYANRVRRLAPQTKLQLQSEKSQPKRPEGCSPLLDKPDRKWCSAKLFFLTDKGSELKVSCFRIEKMAESAHPTVADFEQAFGDALVFEVAKPIAPEDL